MLQLPTWQKSLILVVVVAGLLFAFPNLPLSQRARAKIPTWLPSSAVSLGLDLRGGSSLLLEVDMPEVQKGKANSLMDDIGAALRKANIPVADLMVQDSTVRLRIADAGRYDEARKLVQEMNPTLSTGLAVGGRQYDLSEPGNGAMVLRPTEAFVTQTRQQILEQSRQVVSRRIDEMGTREATVVPQGEDRILVEVPGLSDPGHLKELLGKTAKMTFQLVDESADPAARVAPVGDKILPMMKTDKGPPEPPVVVRRRIIVSGDRLTDAAAGFDSRTSAPVVTLRFDSVGARQFGDVTKDNVGHHFAIVLDDQVIMNANIIEAILGGSAQISGVGTTQQANDLAILLRAGALPAKLNVIQERTIGAELGADSITAGRYSAMVGLGLVMLFMVLRYGLFGLFADIALILNIVLLLAGLTAFNATLTLPGIAGIVLTMGMAVDANVLIFERIREEQRGGRGMLGAIDTGFKRAMATIFDANMTHLIAALILFELGSGAVRGFAVALGIGIFTSFFTSVMVTRLIVVTWLNMARPRTLTI